MDIANGAGVGEAAYGGDLGRHRAPLNRFGCRVPHRERLFDADIGRAGGLGRRDDLIVEPVKDRSSRLEIGFDELRMDAATKGL